MADRNITRRGFFGHTTGAYTAIAMGAGASVLVADPILDLIQRYRASLETFNENATDDDAQWEALARTTYEPYYDRLRDDPPAIATEEGAVEALRLVLDECTYKDPFDMSLITAALAYFDNRAA